MWFKNVTAKQSKTVEIVVHQNIEFSFVYNLVGGELNLFSFVFEYVKVDD